MADNISLNEMIQQIREWQLETDNFRNDSWTQDAYRDKIKELYDLMAPTINNMNSRQRPEDYEKQTNDKEEKSQ